MSEDGTCPVCDEAYNHKITNGYRNQWPSHNIAVCTTGNSDTMYVHVSEYNT